jgi:hypothetical protein
MGIIRKDVQITGLKSALPARALLDTGAVYNHVRQFTDGGTRVESIGVIGYHGKKVVVTATGERVTAPEVVFSKMSLLGSVVVEPHFLVMENLTEEMIVGAATMQSMGIILDPKNHDARIV